MSYRYPDTDPDPAVEIERLRRAWHQARTDLSAARERYDAAMRAEIHAALAFRAVVVDHPEELEQ